MISSSRASNPIWILLLEKMYENTSARRLGRGRRDHATSGWRDRGLFFWIVLILSIYWFILRPLGL